MTTIFAALATLYTSAAQCAAALGISRQAYSQAIKRRRLSESAAIRAAALLKTDAGKVLLCNATGKDIPAPKNHPASALVSKIQDEKKPLKLQAESTKNSHPIQIMRGNTSKKNAIIDTMRKFVHVIPQSAKKLFEFDCVRWMLCVPRISPDSPRFAHYFSRWNVPDKIAAAKKNGTFDDTVKDCPLFSPELTKYIQQGMDEYSNFKANLSKQSKLNDKTIPAVKVLAKAYR